jgi:hypothetical protein
MIGLSAMALGARAAQASFTPFQSPPSREADQAEILGHAYGGTFTASGDDFTNGAIRAVRIDDSSSDQLFTGGTYSVRTLAKFANRTEGFGFVAGDSGGSYHKVFGVSGSNFGASGSATNVDAGSGSVRFAMNGKSAVYTTASSENPGAQDAAITYRIDGVGDKITRYALFWENLNADEPSSVQTRNDFNDLVVEVSRGGGTKSAPGAGGADGATAVPLPPAVWSGGTALVGVLALMRKRIARVVV